MDSRKKLNVEIKKSTLKTVYKYFTLLFCCFAIGAVYPFINIYWGEYSVYALQVIDSRGNSSQTEYRQGSIYFEPIIGKRRVLYDSRNPKDSEYHYICAIAQLRTSASFPIRPLYYDRDAEQQRANENIKNSMSVLIALKMMFGIEHYARIFYLIFFILLPISVFVMNFKLNLNIKDESNNGDDELCDKSDTSNEY